MIRKKSRRKLSLLIASALLFFSCAGAPELPAPPVPDVGEKAPADSLTELTIYFPLETAALADTGQTGSFEDSLIVLRFDRPGAWSIFPERFLFSNGVSRQLEPIQIFGSSRLRRIDMILLRSETQRPAGFLQGRWGKEFFSEDYFSFSLPEALLYLDRSYVKTPLLIRLPEESPQYRRGMQNLSDLPPQTRQGIGELGEKTRKLLDEVLRLGSAGGSRRGFQSLLVIPFDAVQSESFGSYRDGMDLELNFSIDPENLDFSRILAVSPLGKQQGREDQGEKDGTSDLLEQVRIGDLGVFSGATPLLDPKVPRVAGEVYQSGVLTRIGSSKVLRPSPVLWEGSFNAYRDERRKFLFSPGIFSYIPGKHPDLSPEDVRKVTGMEQHEFDRLLQGRSLVTLRHAIYGAIPAFIAASTSPTELEIAFSDNPRLRDALGEFLRQKARLIWLD